MVGAAALASAPNLCRFVWQTRSQKTDDRVMLVIWLIWLADKRVQLDPAPDFRFWGDMILAYYHRPPGMMLRWWMVMNCPSRSFSLEKTRNTKRLMSCDSIAKCWKSPLRTGSFPGPWVFTCFYSTILLMCDLTFYHLEFRLLLVHWPPIAHHGPGCEKCSFEVSTRSPKQAAGGQFEEQQFGDRTC